MNTGSSVAQRAWRLWLVSGWSAAAVLVVEFVVFAILLAPSGDGPHTFANAANLGLILKYSGIYGIGAIGAAMIIGAGGIDLSPGSVIALATVVVGYLFVSAGWSLPAACAGGLLTGAAAGAIVAALVNLVRLPPFIATLGMMGIARGVAFLITEGRYYDLSAKLPADTAPFGIPLAAWPGALMLVLAVVCEIVMVRTARALPA